MSHKLSLDYIRLLSATEARKVFVPMLISKQKRYVSFAPSLLLLNMAKVVYFLSGAATGLASPHATATNES